MKNIFQPLVRRMLLVSCTFLFLTNCGGIVDSLDRYSGETLYEGAVQSNGDILGFVPDIASDVARHLNTKKKKRTFEAFQKDFLTRLVKENPGFARDFYNKMHSDDREKINEALENAGELLKKELQDFTGKSKFDAQDVVYAALEKYDS